MQEAKVSIWWLQTLWSSLTTISILRMTYKLQQGRIELAKLGIN